MIFYDILIFKLKEENKIDESFYEKLKPFSSQPPRLNGLAKSHKPNTHLRPVLSMPGSAYYRTAKQVSD